MQWHQYLSSTLWPQAHLSVACLPKCPDVSSGHYYSPPSYKNSPCLCSQSSSVWATSILAAWSPVHAFSVLQCPCSCEVLLTVTISTWATMSCHNSAARRGVLHHYQSACFHCCSHCHRELAIFHPWVSTEIKTGHFSCSAISKASFTSSHFCDPTWFTLSFSTFRVLSCSIPHSPNQHTVGILKII